MSELTECNYCKLSKIRASVRQSGNKVTLLADAKWGMGGVNVYVHPKAVDIRKLVGGEDGNRAQYRVSWMMEVPDHCCC